MIVTTLKGNIIKIIILGSKVLIIVCLIFGTFQTFGDLRSNALILQVEALGFRNKDFISLTFKKNSVELVTNTSGPVSKNKSVRLGKFTKPLDTELKLLKRQVQFYHTLVAKTKSPVDLSALIKATGFRSTASTPHQPIIKLNGKKLNTNSPYFADLMRVFNNALSDKDKWSCVRCASYKKSKKSIQRIVRANGQKSKNKSFQHRDLECRRLNKSQLECIDKQFGLFRI